MSDSQTIGEQHGCQVCGKLYDLQITYGPDGGMLACVPASPEVRVLPVSALPLIVCVQHSGIEVAAALAEGYSRAFGQNADHDHDHDHDHGDDD